MRSQSFAEVGLRERHKLEKKQAIRAAVRELFSRHGYETATLRQIARRAHVGLGTLFNYAQDKRDLVFLVFNEELAVVAEEALQAARAEARLPEQLLGLFRAHYTFFARNPALSRILLKDMTFYYEGKQAAEYLQIRARLLSGIEEMVRAAQTDGQVRPDEDSWVIAQLIFFAFAGAIRWWIAGQKPDPRKGLDHVKKLIDLQLEGLRPSPLKNVVSSDGPASISAGSRRTGLLKVQNKIG